MRGFRSFSILLFILLAAKAQETALVRGIVHDPQHRPLAGAEIVLRSSALSKTATSGQEGDFQFEGVPPGAYTISITVPAFRPLEQAITISGARTPVMHFQLELQPVTSRVEVSGAPSRLNTQTSTVQTNVAATEVLETPGADQTNSLSMITDFTPGAYMVHDMLHMRGGHQVNWFFDGIPVINTNIAANVAPLIDPKNVQELEIERGGYSSQYGDRTFGFFNVVTPSGFERENEANLILSAGNLYTAGGQFNIGSHTQRFAYYASFDGNRSNLGLATPVSQVIHDQSSNLGGFVSLLYNPSAKDQFRWIGSLRGDHYQIPNDPDAQAAGIRDVDVERDYLAGFHWTHTLSDTMLFTLSPYYHYNSAQFLGGPGDTPYILNDNPQSSYFGGRIVLEAQKKRNDLRVGAEIWGQSDNTFFGLTANPGGSVLNQRERHSANSIALFLEDQFKAASWITFDLGLRLTHYSGLVNENAADPRLGATIRIP